MDKNKKKDEKNSRSNYFRELIGLRIVKMYVEEFFHWGFQQYDQENDDGIDGEIIIRDKGGNDLGARIFVQVKSGPSFISSQNKEFISINAYSAERYAKHQEAYDRFTQPVILVYVNSQKTRNGKKYEDLLCPDAWWVRLDGYQKDDTNLYWLPKTQRFGAHSKGELLCLVKPILNDWNHYPLFSFSNEEYKHFCSGQLSKDAISVYKSWRNMQSLLHLRNSDIPICFTRIGWRHINKYNRGVERKHLSLALLPCAKRIIEEATNENLVLLRHFRVGAYAELFYYGIRVRADLGNGKIEKLQVVLRRWRNKNPKKNIDKWWFYSVHRIKN